METGHVYLIYLISQTLFHQAFSFGYHKNLNEENRLTTTLDDSSTNSFYLNERSIENSENNNEEIKTKKSLGSNIKNCLPIKTQINLNLMMSRLQHRKLCFEQPSSLDDCGIITYISDISEFGFEEMPYLHEEKGKKKGFMSFRKPTNRNKILCFKDSENEEKLFIKCLKFVSLTAEHKITYEKPLNYDSESEKNQKIIKKKLKHDCCFKAPSTLLKANVEIEYIENVAKFVESREKHDDYKLVRRKSAIKLHESRIFSDPNGKAAMNWLAYEYLEMIGDETSSKSIDKIVETFRDIFVDENAKECILHLAEEIRLFLMDNKTPEFCTRFFKSLETHLLKKNYKTMEKRFNLLEEMFKTPFNKDKINKKVRQISNKLEDEIFVANLEKLLIPNAIGNLARKFYFNSPKAAQNLIMGVGMNFAEFVDNRRKKEKAKKTSNDAKGNSKK